MGMVDYVKAAMARRKVAAQARQGMARSYAAMTGEEKASMRAVRMKMDREEAREQLAIAKTREATRQDRKAARDLRQKPFREVLAKAQKSFKGMRKKSGGRRRTSPVAGNIGRSPLYGDSNKQVEILSGGTPMPPKQTPKRRIIIEG